METLFIGRELIEIPVFSSSNTYLVDLIKKTSVIEGLVVWARQQTGGRGQRGNSWESEKDKNLTLSIAIFPSFLDVANQFLINKIASLAISDFVKHRLLIEGISPDLVKIKWPNDIYIKSEKISGILIENSLRANQIQSSVIGIGLNINQDLFKIKGAKPTSLKIISGKDSDLKLCLEALCSFMEMRYLQLKSSKIELINKAYEKLLYKFMVWNNYSLHGKTHNARIIGTSPQGKLILELETKEIIECGIKEIT